LVLAGAAFLVIGVEDFGRVPKQGGNSSFDSAPKPSGLPDVSTGGFKFPRELIKAKVGLVLSAESLV